MDSLRDGLEAAVTYCWSIDWLSKVFLIISEGMDSRFGGLEEEMGMSRVVR